MQWLINIIDALFTDRHRYFDRGDPAAFDFTSVDFIANNVWHDLQLPAFVPSAAALVLFRVVIRAPAVRKPFQLRQKGNVNNYNIATVFTQVANLKKSVFFCVTPDSSGLIQYRASVIIWTNIDLVIAGWWME